MSDDILPVLMNYALSAGYSLVLDHEAGEPLEQKNIVGFNGIISKLDEEHKIFVYVALLIDDPENDEKEFTDYNEDEQEEIMMRYHLLHKVLSGNTDAPAIETNNNAFDNILNHLLELPLRIVPEEGLEEGCENNNQEADNDRPKLTLIPCGKPPVPPNNNNNNNGPM